MSDDVQSTAFFNFFYLTDPTNVILCRLIQLRQEDEKEERWRRLFFLTLPLQACQYCVTYFCLFIFKRPRYSISEIHEIQTDHSKTHRYGQKDRWTYIHT